MIAQINTIEDVKTFFLSVIDEIGEICFHPDTYFEDYIGIENKKGGAYSHDDAELRNNLMEQSFDVCMMEGVDIFDFDLLLKSKKY